MTSPNIGTTSRKFQVDSIRLDYTFYFNFVEYLKYILFPSRLTMLPNKIKSIQEQSELKKIKDVQAFLNFANLYQYFIYNYLNMAVLLICLTQKNILQNFNPLYSKVFNSLKKAFIFAPILTHWVSNTQMIVKTNALDYTLTVILSIIIEEKEVYSVVFHSHTFKAIELNYDTYDKKLSTTFKVFCTWHHYLEKSKLLINVIIDHKNLEYFSTTKVYFYYQTRWSEFLLQFNLIIHFYPGYLGSKPNTLIYKQNLYPREESIAFKSINLYNYQLIFTYSQLITSLQTTTLISFSLCTATIVNLNGLHNDIHSIVAQNSILQEYIYNLIGQQSIDISRLLLMNPKIYILLTNNICIQIFQYYYNYILTGYFRQNKMLKLVHYKYTWLFIHIDIKNLCKSCITCIRSKLQCYKLYRSLRQLLILEYLWNSISMDFI